MIGGIVTSFILELIIYPVIFEIWRGREIRKMLKPEGVKDDPTV
jgi:Cu/Ag efflux pump CusA